MQLIICGEKTLTRQHLRHTSPPCEFHSSFELCITCNEIKREKYTNLRSILEVEMRERVHHHRHRLFFCENESIAVASILCAMATYHFQQQKNTHKSIRFHLHYLSWHELMGAHFNSVVVPQSLFVLHSHGNTGCHTHTYAYSNEWPISSHNCQLNLYLECIYDCVF